MRRVLTIATALACVVIIETFLLLLIAKNFLHLSVSQIQSFIFLKISIAGHLTLFIARTKNTFYAKPYPVSLLVGAILSTQVLADLMVGFGVCIYDRNSLGICWLFRYMQLSGCLLKTP